MLLIAILNILVLCKLALLDIKYHAVPKIATAGFILGSLFITTPQYLIQAAGISIIVYAISRELSIGNGDKKIIFGLTLQLGWLFGITLLLFMLVVLCLQLLQEEKKPIPLIPVILIGYIIRVIYMLGTGHPI
jgi:hypothetical protein